MARNGERQGEANNHRLTYVIVAVVGLLTAYVILQKDAEIDRLSRKIDKLEEIRERCEGNISTLRDQMMGMFDKYTDVVNETLKKVPSGTNLEKIYSTQIEIARVYDDCMKLKEDYTNCKNKAEQISNELQKCNEEILEKSRKKSWFF